MVTISTFKDISHLIKCIIECGYDQHTKLGVLLAQLGMHYSEKDVSILLTTKNDTIFQKVLTQLGIHDSVTISDELSAPTIIRKILTTAIPLTAMSDHIINWKYTQYYDEYNGTYLVALSHGYKLLLNHTSCHTYKYDCEEQYNPDFYSHDCTVANSEYLYNALLNGALINKYIIKARDTFDEYMHDKIITDSCAEAKYLVLHNNYIEYYGKYLRCKRNGDYTDTIEYLKLFRNIRVMIDTDNDTLLYHHLPHDVLDTLEILNMHWDRDNAYIWSLGGGYFDLPYMDRHMINLYTERQHEYNSDGDEWSQYDKKINDAIIKLEERVISHPRHANINIIPHYTKLKILNVSHNPYITTCEPFAKTLRELYIDGEMCGVDNDGMMLCDKLRVLSINYNRRISDCNSSGKTLVELYAHNSDLRDWGLSSCTRLKYLDPTYSRNITECAPFAKTIKYVATYEKIYISNAKLLLCKKLENPKNNY